MNPVQILDNLNVQALSAYSWGISVCLILVFYAFFCLLNKFNVIVESLKQLIKLNESIIEDHNSFSSEIKNVKEQLKCNSDLISKGSEFIKNKMHKNEGKVIEEKLTEEEREILCKIIEKLE